MSNKKSNPLALIFKLLVFAGIVAVIGKFLQSKKDEYAGLTEAEAKVHMETKLAARLGEEKASQIAEQVIPVMSERGMLKSEVGI